MATEVSVNLLVHDIRSVIFLQRRKRFNSLDYMTAYLYRNNPRHRGRETVTLGEIPFVKEEWSIKYDVM